MDAHTSRDLFGPARLGPVQLRNGFIKAATYEGLSRRGRVTDELVAFHRRIAAGGVGMTTLAFCAVTADGRNDRHQIQWHPDTLPGLRRLTEAVHAEGAAVSAQLGHTGPVASPKGARHRMLAPSRQLHASSLGLTRAASQHDIDRVTRAHADAARMAAGCGFDAVEIHCGHNYLISAFLSPRLNRRRDRYGGSLENRARLAREIVRAVRDAVGDRAAIIAKLNLEDGVKGGFGLAEAVQVARWLEQDGSVDALEMTAGSSLLNPMYLFRGRAPVPEFAAAMPLSIRLPVRLGGRALLRTYPYQEGYLLDSARHVRAAVRLPMVLLGGVSSRAVVDRAAREGFQFVAMGRALLREPDLVRRMQADERATSLCDHRNLCMPTILTGIRCGPAAELP